MLINVLCIFNLKNCYFANCNRHTTTSNKKKLISVQLTIITRNSNLGEFPQIYSYVRWDNYKKNKKQKKKQRMMSQSSKHNTTYGVLGFQPMPNLKNNYILNNMNFNE